MPETFQFKLQKFSRPSKVLLQIKNTLAIENRHWHEVEKKNCLTACKLFKCARINVSLTINLLLIKKKTTLITCTYDIAHANKCF